MNDEHEKPITSDRAIEILHDIAKVIPPCPECNQLCAAWTYYYTAWAVHLTIDPEGVLAMFVALVSRMGDRGIIIVRSELEQATRDKQVLISADPARTFYHAKVLTGPDKKKSDFQVQMQTDAEWPDNIDDDPS